MDQQHIHGKRIVLAGLVSSKVKLDTLLPPIRKQIQDLQGQLVGELVQRRGVSRSKKPGGSNKLTLPLSAQTYISVGKVDELKDLCLEKKVELVVFFNGLTAKQVENLEHLIGLPVLTMPSPQ